MINGEKEIRNQRRSELSASILLVRKKHIFQVQKLTDKGEEISQLYVQTVK